MDSDKESNFLIFPDLATSTALITGFIPVLDVNMPAFSVRTPLAAGTVTLSGNAILTAGELIQLRYVASGFT